MLEPSGNGLALSDKDLEQQEKRWNEIRRSLSSRLISCNDCRQLRDDLVKVMDLLSGAPIPEEKPTLMTRKHGTEIAPGVVIIPADPEEKTPPNVRIIPADPGTSRDNMIVIPPKE